MKNYDFNVLVIGSGPGGYIAALRAAELGLSVACVEKMDALGGTCLNVGCIPSKALLHSSAVYERIKKMGAEEGVTVKDVAFDLTAMMKRKDGVVKGLNEGIAFQFKKLGVVSIRGNAAFVDAHTIEVQGKRITADNFIVATGSEPIALPFLPFDEKYIVSSTGALSLGSVPKKMLVIGAGAIGVELASVYSRLGCAVSVVEMLDTITPAMDATLCKHLQQMLKKQGIEFYLQAKVKGGVVKNEAINLIVEYEAKESILTADVVLVAVGRRPYITGLGLEAIGITPSPKGFIPIDQNFRTFLPHIFALGDVVEGPMLAHRASHEGVAVANLIGGVASQINYVSIPNVIYTHPEAASVGFTETEARSAGFNISVGMSHFRANGRARCIGETEGFVKIIGDLATGRLLGMHILGAEASEMIAEGVIALDMKTSVADMGNACHPHPTLSEAISEACKDARPVA
ncbi:MAG: dihydrolipoyl dehydrogenase [Parachlamydiaceae bacterium]